MYKEHYENNRVMPGQTEKDELRARFTGWLDTTLYRAKLKYLEKQKQMESGEVVKPSLLGNQAEKKRWVKYMVYYNTPLMRRAHWYFLYRYFIKLGFLDGKEGLIFHFLQGYWYRFLVDSKIYEAQKNGSYKDTFGDLKA